MSNLIIIPFAYKQGASTGVNIKRQSASLDIYLKNCCVALISAMKNSGPDTDCALVTNIQIPNKYAEILVTNGIEIFLQDFDCFNFGDSYRWSLAFYKLCALYRIVRCTDYENYAYLDSDVIVQDTFEHIWKKCSNHILMYNLNVDRSSAEFKCFYNEAIALLDSEDLYHYGGEFFAADRDSALNFSNTSLSVFDKMRENNVMTSHGDEFIISIAAQYHKSIILDAGAYISRLWTGTYRHIPISYPTSVVLHLPAEKECGMIRLYEKYISLSYDLPVREKIYSICNIYSPSLLTRFKKIIKALLFMR